MHAFGMGLQHHHPIVIVGYQPGQTVPFAMDQPEHIGCRVVPQAQGLTVGNSIFQAFPPKIRIYRWIAETQHLQGYAPRLPMAGGQIASVLGVHIGQVAFGQRAFHALHRTGEDPRVAAEQGFLLPCLQNQTASFFHGVYGFFLIP